MAFGKGKTTPAAPAGQIEVPDLNTVGEVGAARQKLAELKQRSNELNSQIENMNDAILNHNNRGELYRPIAEEYLRTGKIPGPGEIPDAETIAALRRELRIVDAAVTVQQEVVNREIEKAAKVMHERLKQPYLRVAQEAADALQTFGEKILELVRVKTILRDERVVCWLPDLHPGTFVGLLDDRDSWITKHLNELREAAAGKFVQP